MASHQPGRDHSTAYQAGQLTGQAQLKRDEFESQATSNQSSQTQDLKGQASSILQQTGEQVKNMAQGAAEAVKNTLGMNNPPDNSSTRNTNCPGNNPNNPCNSGNNPGSHTHPSSRG